MQSSALLLILFIHCSAAFYDLVIIISQSYHHSKATCSARFSRWYYAPSIVRALKEEIQTNKGITSGWVSSRKNSLVLSPDSVAFQLGLSGEGKHLEVANQWGALSRCNFFPSSFVPSVGRMR